MVLGKGIADRVVFTNTIREDVCHEALLTFGEIFVFATLYEGFGLPTLEGWPVVRRLLLLILLQRPKSLVMRVY